MVEDHGLPLMGFGLRVVPDRILDGLDDARIARRLATYVGDGEVWERKGGRIG